MPTTITPVDTYPASFTEAADGESVNQATRTNVIQEYADAINFLKNRIPGVGGVVTQRKLFIPLGTAPQYKDITGATVNYQRQSSGGLLQQVVSPDTLHFSVPHIPGAKFSELVCALDGDIAGTHAGNVGTPPFIELRRASDDYGHTIIASASDPNASPLVAAYDQEHTFNTTFTQQTMNDTNRFIVTYKGEGGANAQTNGTILYSLYLVLDDQT